VTKDNRRLTVRVFFREYQPCMVLGVPNIEAVNCTFCGADAVLDLHRPSCAARVAGYVFGGLCRRDDVGEVRLENGDDILRAVGYKGFEHPRVSEEK